MIYFIICLAIFFMFADPISPRRADVDRKRRPPITFFAKHPSLGVLAWLAIIAAAAVVDGL